MAGNLGSFKSVGPVTFESVSNVTATPSTELGARRIHNGEEYVYFRNDTGSAATQGMAMVISGNSGYSLTRSSTTGDDFVVCFVKHADVADDSYAWGLVRGITQVHVASTLATGQLFQVGADGVVATYVATATGECIGKMILTGTDSTGNAWVDCHG